MNTKLGGAKAIRDDTGFGMDRDVNGARGIFLRALGDSPFLRGLLTPGCIAGNSLSVERCLAFNCRCRQLLGNTQTGRPPTQRIEQENFNAVTRRTSQSDAQSPSEKRSSRRRPQQVQTTRWLEPGVYDRRRCHSRDPPTQPVSSWLRIRSNLIM